MIKWSGWLITLFASAHTILALTFEKAARHAGTWFSGGLWGEDLSAMSPANSAYWLSLYSFGPPLILVGLIVLWLDRRHITPPAFLAWALGAWTVVGAVVLVTTPWPILLIAEILLLAGIHRNTGPVLEAEPR
ncbi:DUF6463 family protein [Nocardia seriolae]|uniref:Uncharacterized protein n=1 Tax=Nocardia seriolae TaxID=37332 RepID=A0A0B8NHJ3_9NOCA|nr:DUF6463 family protein [Nocardia seriolae]APA98368.1 hypothetical protein NS506_04320 [Nocardia seriolae]MTJ64159.1 hypothetical protein [Nocardia seriolae]MTJ76562.1 hypothetical protein [Nocardia seriolae]MTJ88064.1 hypothetical protein [Nocardia seriolae]MTK32054.1 hypothetical protein [Nocardia seriolae]